MNDRQCVEFLQWALPRLGMRWQGFRKVRRPVCKRVRRRAEELELSDLTAYRTYLQQHPEEWAPLEGLTRITISRFNRDRGVFAFVEQEVLRGRRRRRTRRHSRWGPALADCGGRVVQLELDAGGSAGSRSVRRARDTTRCHTAGVLGPRAVWLDGAERAARFLVTHDEQEPSRCEGSSDELGEQVAPEAGPREQPPAPSRRVRWPG
jgi:hypothetical protein